MLVAKLKMGYEEVLVFASLDVFTKKERGYLVGLGELEPDFKVRGRWGFPLLGFGDSQEDCPMLPRLILLNTTLVPDSDPQQHHSPMQCWRTALEPWRPVGRH